MWATQPGHHRRIHHLCSPVSPGPVLPFCVMEICTPWFLKSIETQWKLEGYAVMWEHFLQFTTLSSPAAVSPNVFYQDAEITMVASLSSWGIQDQTQLNLSPRVKTWARNKPLFLGDFSHFRFFKREREKIHSPYNLAFLNECRYTVSPGYSTRPLYLCKWQMSSCTPVLY